jgi:hypothetical protein
VTVAVASEPIEGDFPASTSVPATTFVAADIPASPAAPATTFLVADETIQAPGFAPNEPTDERGIGDWATRYPPDARNAIRVEAVFVSICLLVSLIGTLAVAIESASFVVPMKHAAWLALSPYLFAYLGGLLGGTLFTMKWLYHTVAKGIWNRDRRLWRVFTPFLSGGASLAVILLCASGALPFFGPQLVRTNAGALGLSIVLGYFSDRAFSALERFAEGGFGMKAKITGADKP